MAGRDNMWKILNHDTPITPPLGGQGNRNAAVLQPLAPQGGFKDKPNPVIESMEQMARLAARANQNRPGFLEPLSNSLPSPLDRALVPVPQQLPPPPAWEDAYPPRREVGVSIPQLVDMEQRIAMCERAAKLLPLMDQKLLVLERRQDVDGGTSTDVVRGMQGYIDKLERRVGDMQSIMTRALGEFNELKLRDDALQRDLGEARIYIKRLENMIATETTSQLQELRARDERNVAIREENRKQQMAMQDEVLGLSREVESLRAHLGGMQSDISTQMARIGSRIEQDEGFLSKMRESEVESIQANSSNFARMRSEVMQLQSSIQMLEKAMQEQVLLIRSDGDRVGSRVREVEGLLQATESAAVRKAIAIAEGWFKELQRSVAEVTDASRSHANSLLQEVDSRLQNMDRSMGRERQVVSDRIVGLEKNMREVIGLQQVAEEGLRRKLDMSTSDFGAILEDTRRIIEEKEGKMKHEMEGGFKKVKTSARDLEERFEREQKQLEEVIKAEIKARMASYEKVQRLVNRFTGEFQAKLAQTEKRLKDAFQSQIDRVREETSSLAVEHVLEETMLREEIIDSLQALEKDVFDEVKALSEETRDVFSSLSDTVRDVGTKLADMRVDVAQTVHTELTSLGARIATESVERHEALVAVKKDFLEGLADEVKERSEQHMGMRQDLTRLERKVGSADLDIAGAVQSLGEAVTNLDYNVNELQVRASTVEKGINNLTRTDHDLHKAITETRATLDSYSIFFKEFLKISEIDRLAEIVPSESGDGEGIPSIVQSLIAMHHKVEDLQTSFQSANLSRWVTEPQALRMVQDEGQKIMLAILKESSTILRPMLESARDSDRKSFETTLDQKLQRHLETDHAVWGAAAIAPRASASVGVPPPQPPQHMPQPREAEPLPPAPSPSPPAEPELRALEAAPSVAEPETHYEDDHEAQEETRDAAGESLRHRSGNTEEEFQNDDFGTGNPPVQVMMAADAFEGHGGDLGTQDAPIEGDREGKGAHGGQVDERHEAETGYEHDAYDDEFEGESGDTHDQKL